MFDLNTKLKSDKFINFLYINAALLKQHSKMEWAFLPKQSLKSNGTAIVLPYIVLSQTPSDYFGSEILFKTCNE